MKLTLLSPSPAKLQAMAAEWKKSIDKEGFDPGDLEAAWEALAGRKKFLPKKGLLGTTRALDNMLKEQFKIDAAKANGSSIAFLAEFGDKAALLLGDAHPDVVVDSLKRLLKKRRLKKLRVDAVKIAHHGSKNNTNEELLALIASPTYLISSSGAQFNHPDKACMARIVKFGKPKTIVFNYRSAFTKPWIAKSARDKHGYRAQVRNDKDLSIAVEL
jgi:hypothetical protein